LDKSWHILEWKGAKPPLHYEAALADREAGTVQNRVVTREIPLPKDREGKPRMGELLKAIRELVRHSRTVDPELKGQELYDVGFRTDHNQGTVRVQLYFK
jgi:hypothetical protein